MIELPKRMRTLERDERGYPIPFVVLRGKSGTPYFTINDTPSVRKCATKSLCAICGKRQDAAVWFVGGSRCFLHEHGAFVDPPLHLECAEFALQTCPFLAAPRYLKRIDMKKLRPGDVPDGMGFERVPHMLPAQPERFGLGACRAVRTTESGLFVVDSWDYVEFWRNGARVDAPNSATVADLVAV